jgi:ABC-type multidrug transport system fused ATPase/permease subunit
MSRRGARVRKIISRLLADRDQMKDVSRGALRRLWREHLHEYRLGLFLVLILTIIWSAPPFAFPMTLRYLLNHILDVDTGFPPSELRARSWMVLFYGLVNAGIWALWLFSNWTRSRIVIGIGKDLVFKLRKRLHAKLQVLHVGFYERTPAGIILSRVLDDVNVIMDWTTSQGVALFSNVARLVMGTVILFYLDRTLAPIAIAALPIYAVSFGILRPKIARAHLALRRLNSQMYALAGERISGIRVVKAFNAEKRELSRFTHLVNDSTRVGMRAILYGHGLAVLAGLFTAVTTGSIAYLTSVRVMANEMSTGDMLAFYFSLMNMFEPVNQLTSLATELQSVFIVIGRVFAVLDEPEDVRPGKVRLTGIDGRIEFDRVTFSYPGQAEPALRNVDVRIPPGERVALVGPSGAGKSTVFQLLMRFYDPQNGAVRVGGVDLKCADPGSVRRHVCMVQQEPVVFSGTLADAVVYGRLDATPAQTMKAAEQAELHTFIMSLPLKYETEVGENGVTLSGGQKQRLALATALLTEPEILLLDDTTSALDAATEARIRKTLNEVLEGRTSIIITQRIATARGCDRVIVLERGEITQMGTHEELSRAQGFYRRICLQQEAGQTAP